MYRLPLLVLGLTCIAALAAADDTIEGIGPVGPPQVVHDGFRFTEGPAADAEGNLYFTDVFGGAVHRANPGGDVATILTESQGTNGLMVDPAGHIIGCQGAAGRIIAIDPATGAVTPLVTEYEGKRFIQPNDLVLDSEGGVYFTDPRFGRATGDGNTQEKPAVYYAASDGTVVRLLDDLSFPNGILLAPDEKTLYVLPLASTELMAYPVDEPGKIGAGRAIYEMPADKNGRRRGGDGLTVDKQGNLYLTAPAISSICVVDAEGAEKGRIEIPKAPSNCAFGGSDLKTLYVTARDTVYAYQMLATGHCLAAPGD